MPAGGERRDLVVSAVPLRNVEGAVQGILTLVADVTDRRRLADEHPPSRAHGSRRPAGRKRRARVQQPAHLDQRLYRAAPAPPEGGRARRSTSRRPPGGDASSVDAHGSVAQPQRAFVREPVVLAPASAVRSLAEVLERVVPAEVELVWSLDDRAGRVRIDEGQFEQLVVNLAVNARDAIVGSGEIHLVVQGVNMDVERTLSSHYGLVAMSGSPWRTPGAAWIGVLERVA